MYGLGQTTLLASVVSKQSYKIQKFKCINKLIAAHHYCMQKSYIPNKQSYYYPVNNVYAINQFWHFMINAYGTQLYVNLQTSI